MIGELINERRLEQIEEQISDLRLEIRMKSEKIDLLEASIANLRSIISSIEDGYLPND